MARTKRDGNRYYEINGKKYVSVTSILKIISKPELIAWAAKEGAKSGDANAAEKIKTAAANRGTAVHQHIEAILRGASPPPLPEDLRGYGVAFEEFMDRHKVRVIEGGSEETVYHETEGYAGTLDWRAEIDGWPCLVDFKTVSNDSSVARFPPYKEHRLQLEAYRRAKLAMSGDWYPGVAIIRMGSKGTLGFSQWVRIPENPETVAESEEAWKGFLAARDLFLWCREYDEKTQAWS